MSTVFNQLASLSLADRPRQSTPFPHDASTILYRGESGLNAAHLRSADAPSTRSTGIRGTPAGGRFWFQFREKRVILRERIITSHKVASAKGVRVLGYKRCIFYAANAGLGRPLQARSVSGHFYPNFDIVYSIRDDKGELIAKGNAEFLDAVYGDVAFALKGYWDRKSPAKIRGFYIRRYFAHHQCLGPFRTCVYRFLRPEDLLFLNNTPVDIVDALAGIMWMDEKLE